MHSKYLVIDGKVGLVSSYNLTASSKVLGEMALLFDSKKSAQDLQLVFKKDLKLAKRITRLEMKEFLRPPKIRDRFILGLFKIFEIFCDHN